MHVLIVKKEKEENNKELKEKIKYIYNNLNKKREEEEKEIECLGEYSKSLNLLKNNIMRYKNEINIPDGLLTKAIKVKNDVSESGKIISFYDALTYVIDLELQKVNEEYIRKFSNKRAFKSKNQEPKSDHGPEITFPLEELIFMDEKVFMDYINYLRNL